MKLKNLTLTAFLLSVMSCSGCDKHDHDHDHADGDHKHGEEGKKDDHDHEKQAGPNGGRVLHDVEPHAEFFVMDDRKVRITFVNDDLKAIPAGEQVVSVIAGERAAPTELSFTKVGDVLVSDKALPASDNFPVVVMISAKAGAKAVIVKFQGNMVDCPTCDYLEYACTCDHDHGDGEHKH